MLDSDPADEVKQLLSGKPVMSLKDNRPKAVSSIMLKVGRKASSRSSKASFVSSAGMSTML